MLWPIFLEGKDAHVHHQNEKIKEEKVQQQGLKLAESVMEFCESLHRLKNMQLVKREIFLWEKVERST